MKWFARRDFEEGASDFGKDQEIVLRIGVLETCLIKV